MIERVEPIEEPDRDETITAGDSCNCTCNCTCAATDQARDNAGDSAAKQSFQHLELGGG